MTATLCASGSILAAPYALFYYAYDPNFLPAALTALFFSTVGAAPFLWRYSPALSLIAACSTTMATFMAMTWFFGLNSGLFVFIFLVPLAGLWAFGCGRPRLCAFVSALAVISLVLCATALDKAVLMTAPDPVFRTLTAVSSMVLMLLFLHAFGFAASRRSERAEDLVMQAHARSEALLLNLLPAEIALRLKARPNDVIADEIEDMTVLFADIVDFTPMAAAMTPKEVVGLLGRVFAAFDDLAAARGLEKIKTVGDAYMVAAGLPMARPDHATAIAETALEMLEAAERIGADTGRRLQVRIGVHAGPAVAGVIGQKKVFYDVWGDTINMAARLESEGEAGRIQVGADLRRRLAAEFQFERRGVIDLKGKGQVETFWLTGRKPRAADPVAV